MEKWRGKSVDYTIEYTAYFGSVQRLHRIKTTKICSEPGLLDYSD